MHNYMEKFIIKLPILDGLIKKKKKRKSTLRFYLNILTWMVCYFKGWSF